MCNHHGHKTEGIYVGKIEVESMKGLYTYWRVNMTMNEPDRHEWRNKWGTMMAGIVDFCPNGQYHGNVNRLRDYIVEFITTIRNAEIEIRMYEQNVGLGMADVGLDCADLFLGNLCTLGCQTLGVLETAQLVQNALQNNQETHGSVSPVIE